jgi:FtsP/CotA-like multicopper oxidase with cupredoxin domain
VVIFQSRITDEAISPIVPVPTSLAVIADLPPATVTRTLRLEESSMGGSGMMDATFSINGQSHPVITPLSAVLGSVEEWTIENTTEMDHPFHLHGFRFQLTAENGQRPDFSAWRDTINIRSKSRSVFKVRLEDHPGVWMFHCHILEHAERGMMGELHVGGN